MKPVAESRMQENTTSAVHPIRKAGLFYFVWIMFSYTTGAPWGLEDQVTNSGPGLTLILHLLVPFLWCIPLSLVAAELTTAMPVEGGFYRWVHTAFGDFWGFLAGWWDWCSALLLASSYAVFFVDGLRFFFPQLTGWKHYALAMLVIAIIAYINIRGIQVVGRLATVLEFLVLSPVVALCVVALPKWHYNPFSPMVPPDRPLYKAFGVGLALAMWLYSGYEELSTVAGEIENPQRNFVRAIVWVIPLSMAVYFFTTMFCLAALGNWQVWHGGYFIQAGAILGGRWLGDWITLATGVVFLSLLNSTILASTRVPFAMSEEGQLPAVFARIHRRFRTPWAAILISAAVYAALAGGTFVGLITVYVWLRIGASILTLLSAWRLRHTQPDLPRPFRIPGGSRMLAYVTIAPILLSIVALLGSETWTKRWGGVALLTGPVAYLLFARTRGRPAHPAPMAEATSMSSKLKESVQRT